MTLGKSIYQNLFWKGLYYVSLFALNVAIARFFTASISGWIFYTTNSYSLILLISSLSLESGMMFYLSKNEINPFRLVSFSLLWSLFIGLLTLLYFFIFGKGQLHLPEGNLMLQTSATYICGYIMIIFFPALFSAKKDFRTPNIVMTIFNLGLLLLLILPWKFGKEINSSIYIKIYFTSFLLEGLIIASTFIFKYNKAFQFALPNKIELKRIFKYSLLAFSSNIIFFLVYRVDYWFVNFYCNAIEMGNYIQVSKLVQLMITVPSTISIVLFPFIASGQKDVVNTLLLLSRSLMLYAIFVCIGTASVGYWLFPFIFGPSFSNMYLPYLMLIPGVFALILNYPFAAYYSGINKVRKTVYANLLALVLIIFFDIVLIPKFGISGAAMSSSIGYFSCLTYIMWNYKNDNKIKFKDCYIYKKGDLDKILINFKLR